MKILCVIDSLGSGGAQRQMVNLASGLKERGYEVELFIYYPQLDFYREIIESAGIPINEVYDVSGFSFKVIRAIAKLLNSGGFDVLISFLRTPNIYSILAGIFSFSSTKILVSERNNKKEDTTFLKYTIVRILYITADYIIVNSHDQKKLYKKHKLINNKVFTIYNGFRLTNTFPQYPTLNRASISLLVIGRNTHQKNGIRLAKALLHFYKRNGFVPKVSWAGRQEQDPQSLSIRAEMDNIIASNSSLQNSWQWLGERSDIPLLLEKSDALIHVSLYEGLPNAICEAFIEGRPVIASAVCDHPLLVKDGVRGLLCDPLSPESICNAIERFISLSIRQRQIMGYNARQYAEEYLTLDRMVKEYEDLLR